MTIERSSPVTATISQSDVEMLKHLADSMGFGRTHDMLRRVIAACSGRAQCALKLGDVVRMNERSPYFSDWRNATMKVVSLRIDPDGKQWASVIEGDQRHRGNGVYDGETTDIDADHLSAVTSTERPAPVCVCCGKPATGKCEPNTSTEQQGMAHWNGKIPPEGARE